MNHALAYRREQVNDLPFQTLAGIRRSVFEASERATLRPLPVERYEVAEWKTAKVNVDYHISVEGHLYSVPNRLVGAEVSVRLTTTMLEVMQHGTRVAAHARSARKGRYTTEPTHRPTSSLARDGVEDVGTMALVYDLLVDRGRSAPIRLIVTETAPGFGLGFVAREAGGHKLLDAPLQVEAQLVVHGVADARSRERKAEHSAEMPSQSIAAHRAGSAVRSRPTVSV